ncbi:MAG TPA: CDP-alcohol phosphatidyltransferase family protein [Candidatus Omnitrophota bacterium]|nr:CDP-alcohol phosphatidyltransferase family protein [Candidatus Omnitrophota bacterium]
MPDPRPVARWIGWTPLRVWGLTPPQRLKRSLARAGLRDVAAWPGDPPAGDVLLFLGDVVYDHDLVMALTRSPATLLLVEDRPVAAHVPATLAEAAARALQGDAPPEGLALVQPADLVASHRAKLRKREPPVVLEVTARNVRAVEDRLFGASYKGVTDAITKYLWPAPARLVTRWCAAARIPPNAVTLVGLVLTVLAFLLFRDGWLWAGLAAAWAMTFLDTVDGKLARVTLTSSKAGDVLDHGLDLVHPPFWWWAWWQGAGGGDWDALVVVVAGYAFLRLQEGLFMKAFGFELHVWQRFDSLFRLVTARRNPILAILTIGLALGAPQGAMVAVAAWTFLSLAVHAARILMAARVREEGGQVVSWLDR